MLDIFFSSPTVVYCEKAANGFVKRPWYLISNLAFLVSGLMIMRKGKFDYLSRLFGGSVILIGLFSSVYDTTFTRWSQLVDLSGMILFVSLLIWLTALSTFNTTKLRVAAGLTSAYLISLSAMLYFGSVSGNIIFAAYVIVLIALGLMAARRGLHKNYQPFIIATGLLAVGFGFWLTDISQVLCFRIGLLNGRAIFHYLVAIAVYYVYTFYASQSDVLGIK
jgi:hypothetical protein